MDDKQFELILPAEHPVFPGHFPGEPVLPGAMLLALVQAEVLRGTAWRLGGISKVRFLAPVRGGQRLIVHCRCKLPDLQFRCYAERELVARGRLRLMPADGT